MAMMISLTHRHIKIKKMVVVVGGGGEGRDPVQKVREKALQALNDNTKNKDKQDLHSVHLPCTMEAQGTLQ